jgi:cysteine desulfurase family protein (TIGR01976 family)
MTNILATRAAVPLAATAGDAIASTAEIRAHFPALERIHAGRPVAYFDGPGGTQTPRAVADAMVDYLYHHNANAHWAYPTSAETDAILDGARAAMADFLNASPGEVVFGANSTTLAFHASRAIGAQCSAGDELVITEVDHHANVGPWQALAREQHVTLRVVRMDPQTGALDWDDFESNVSARTKLVAVSAASNALGTITDVKRAVELAHSVGAWAFVDAVHYAPHNLVDVRGMDCDFSMCSAYKFYGPHVGVLYCRRELLESLPFAKLQPAPDIAPDRAETGTLNHEGIAGAAAAVDFLASLAPAAGSRREQLRIAFEGLHQRGTSLMQRIWKGLESIDGVTLYGPRPDAPRTSTVAFTVRGIASSEVARRLSERALFLSHGDFYALTVIERLGLASDGLVRAGCACYTTEEEVDRLVDAVREVARV